MQPDNEKIIDLVAQADSYMRELIVDVIKAGATAPTISALSEALNAINYSYATDTARIARSGILAPPVSIANQSSSDIQNLVLKTVETLFEKAENRSAS